VLRSLLQSLLVAVASVAPALVAALLAVLTLLTLEGCLPGRDLTIVTQIGGQDADMHADTIKGPDGTGSATHDQADASNKQDTER